MNIPRIVAKEFRLEENAENAVWISISEPDDICSVISNPILDKCPSLKLSFWDLSEDIEYEGKIIGPPKLPKIAKMVNFLVKHQGKNVIVNCAAGVSRSGAVARFCEDELGYIWPKFFQNLSCPNVRIYRDMVNFYQEKYKTL